MYVYVTYDPLLEKVVCVHDKSNKLCSKCGKIWRERERNKSLYQLVEEKRMLKTKLIDIS